jgi:hypothetical protein
LQYPAGEIASPYVSKGCDWVVQEENPITGRPYGTLEHVAKCHFESERIGPETAASELNGLDDGTAEWIIRELEHEIEYHEEQKQQQGITSGGTTGSGFTSSMLTTSERKQVTDEIFWTGPTLLSDNTTSVLTAGKAVFDRLTGELIGFVTADVIEAKIAADLDTRVLEERADVYVVDYQSGTIISKSSEAEHRLSSTLPQFDNIKSYLNFDTGGDKMRCWERFDINLNDNLGSNQEYREDDGAALMIGPCIYIEELPTGGILTATPLPLPPTANDTIKRVLHPPSAYVVQIISNDVFSIVQKIEESIDQDVRRNITWSCVAGVLGLAAVLVLLSVMSSVLTRPLTWITDVSRQIIYNDYGKKNKFFSRQQEEEEDGSEQNYDRDRDNRRINEYAIASNHEFVDQGIDDNDEHDTFPPVLDDRAVGGRCQRSSKRSEEEEPEFRSEVMPPTSAINMAMNSAEESNVMTQMYPEFLNANEVEEGSETNDKGSGDHPNMCHNEDFRSNSFDDYRLAENRSRRCMPRTEIRQLVEEFQTMIHGFSGSGPSHVAEPAIFQLKNNLTWHDDFAKLYDSEGLTRRSFRQTSQSTEASGTEITDITCPTQQSLPLTFQEEDGIREVSSSLRQLIPDRATKSYLDAAIETEQQPGFQSQDMSFDEKTDEYLGSTLEIRPPRAPMTSDADTLVADIDESEATGPLRDQKYDGIESDVESGSITDEDEKIMGSTTSAMLDSSQRKSNVNFVSPIVARAKIHRNPVLGTPNSEKKPVLHDDGASDQARVYCSKLFWCILFLMALPVFLTAMTVSAIASSSVSKTLPDWIVGAEVASISIEKDTLQFVARRKASVFSTLTQGTIRDLHFMNRITNWLYFGGIQRSTTFTEMNAGAEACKEYYEAGLSNIECPALLNLPCSCDWEDLRQYTELSPSCRSDYEAKDSRYLQTQHFSVQALDSDPVTGNRYSSSSYPSTSYSPATTSWWSNISTLPGSDKGPVSSSGYATLYDRLAVASASAVYNLPIYNYATSLNRPKDFLANYLTFEDDGGIMGWTGCHYGHTTRSNWVSTVENGGAVVNNKLCPLGR